MSVLRAQAATPETQESLRKFAQDLTGWQVKDAPIKGITVRALSRRLHRLVEADIRVGQELGPDVSSEPHEPVAAIFESNAYLVVTPALHGAGDKTVYFFQPEEVTRVERG
jgi:hypothetical protein